MVRPWLAMALVVTAAPLGCDPARGVPLFLWHSVGEQSPHDRRDVPVSEFDAALTLVERWGAQAISLDELLDGREGRRELPRRAVVLTFDDGRASLQTGAGPVLARHHMRAELFVVSSLMAVSAAARHMERDDAGVHPFLTWDELQAMADGGAFIVESHARTHRNLSALGTDEQRTELAASRAELQARTGQPVNFIAYPFGAFDRTTLGLAEEVGYRGGLSVQKGWGGRYAMRRHSVHAGATEVVERALRSTFGEP